MNLSHLIWTSRIQCLPCWRWRGVQELGPERTWAEPQALPCHRSPRGFFLQAAPGFLPADAAVEWEGPGWGALAVQEPGWHPRADTC